MKIRKRLGILLLALLLCPFAGGTAQPVEGGGSPTDPGIHLYPGHAELAQGASLKLYAYTLPEDPNAAFLWESSDPAVAGVDQGGRIMAQAPGEAAITVSLGQAPGQKAVCTVSVREEGMTLLYNNTPAEPPPLPPEGPGGPVGDGDSQEEGGAEEGPSEEAQGQEGSQEEGGDIPVEYGEPIPVEIIPSIDEFIWTIKIDDTYDWQSTQGGMVMHVLNRLQFTGVKHGGKTPFGEYQCKGGVQADYPEAEIDAYIAPSGGSAKSQFNPTSVIEDFVCVVKPIKPEAIYPKPEDAELRAILRDNYTGTADGEVVLKTAGGGTVTITGQDITVTGNHQMNLAPAFPYRLRIGKSGRVFFSYVTKATQNNIFFFTGKLYKTPIIPK